MSIETMPSLNDFSENSRPTTKDERPLFTDESPAPNTDTENLPTLADLPNNVGKKEPTQTPADILKAEKIISPPPIKLPSPEVLEALGELQEELDSESGETVERTDLIKMAEIIKGLRETIKTETKEVLSTEDIENLLHGLNVNGFHELAYILTNEEEAVDFISEQTKTNKENIKKWVAKFGPKQFIIDILKDKYYVEKGKEEIKNAA